MTGRIKGPSRGKKEPKGDYEVGYAKPPKRTQFQQGNQFGKQGGRPKGRRNDMTMVRKILSMRIEQLAGRDISKLTVMEGLLLKQVQRAIANGGSAFEAIIKLAMQAGLLQPEPADLPEEELSPHEIATIEDFIASLEAGGHPALSGGRPGRADEDASEEMAASPSAAPVEQAAPAPARRPAPPIVTIVPGRPTVRRVNFAAGAAHIRGEATA